MFATFVVGSLPRPVWVRELIERRKRGEVGAAAAERVLDDAVPAAIRMQEAAGMDFVSDGEWRRESYVKVFADAVAGFEPDLIAGGRGAAYPAVTATLRQERPIALDEARFVQRTIRQADADGGAFALHRRAPHVESRAFHGGVRHARGLHGGVHSDHQWRAQAADLAGGGRDPTGRSRGWRCWWIRSTGSGLGLTTSIMRSTWRCRE